MDVLANAVAVIILQHISISDHHLVHLKLNVLCQLYFSKAGVNNARLVDIFAQHF